MEETAVLLTQAQAGDRGAREILIEKNLGLVHHIVKRFLGRGYEAEDLFQIGSIGLMKAIDKFDLTYEVKFSTYAVPMIAGEIKRFLRDDGMVKVSRTLKENGMKIKQAADEVSKELGREATISEISELTGISVEDIVVAMEANAEVESIYKSVYQSDGNEIYMVDRLPSGKDDNEKVLNHILLEQLLSELTDEEKRLIALRYFQDKTQVEVARQLGISQVQVSRLEKRILLRMRGLAN
ncbi:MAG: RNA polymerase sporulation sigma factor, SigF/SigG family [Lachnospiraceae bacterium]|jgi:RNA polymerase sporulation-specific sigma factor|nr:RNA polymerase sporulation sigma factor, SigF/SigG family [Lachnospiraceae bacterium]